VQAFQHIPNFACCCKKANRVLTSGGVIYSLQNTRINRMVYWLLGKSFQLKVVYKILLISAAPMATNNRFLRISSKYGGGDPYTECLKYSDLRLTFGGRIGTQIRQFDTRLCELPWLGRWIARQLSFKASNFPFMP
jgi:hypothetical protein